MLSLDSCSTSCGYIAIVIASFCFGSFSAPMKSEAAKSVDIDPLVFQTYKTSVYLAISLTLVLLGQDVTFTPWGIVSGLLWVPAGVMHVLAVRTAGMAIASGTCASITVLVSFAWGMFVFHERVRSIALTAFGIFLVISGMIGMSYFSSQTASTTKTKISVSKKILELSESKHKSSFNRNKPEYGWKPLSTHSKSKLDLMDNFNNELEIVPLQTEDLERNISITIYEEGNTFKGKAKSVVESGNGSVAMVQKLSTHLKNQYNLDISTRNLGFIIAVIGGIWGGSVMVPLHYVDSKSKGFNYVLSFAIGTSIVNILSWIIRFYYIWNTSSRNLRTAYLALPSFHIRTMLIPGACSGALYCCGNLASIVSVTYLGEGVGYSMTQSSMLVSGLWGIFWYREITDPLSIRGWLITATITLTGMMILCLSHVSKTAPAILDV